MKGSRYFKAMVTVMLLTCWSMGYPPAMAAGLVYLKPVKASTVPDGVQVDLQFQRRGEGLPVMPVMDEGSFSYGDGWAQAEVRGVYIDPPKQSLSFGKGPLLELLTYQYDKDIVRLRFYSREAGNNFQNRIKVQRAGPDRVTLLVITGNVEPKAITPPRLIHEDAARVRPPVMEASKLPPQEVATVNATKTTQENLGGTPPAEAVIAKPVVVLPSPAVTPTPRVSDVPVRVTGQAGPDLLFSSLKMLAALALVLAIMVGCFYIFKKTLGHKLGLSGKNRLIRVISTVYIGPKKSITLVEVAGETLVLGISGDQMTLLSKMAPAEDRTVDADVSSAMADKEPVALRSFDGFLQSSSQASVPGEDLWSKKES